MITRLGKIARLPENIRLELNHRLLNGAGGPRLLAWLNSLPEVLTVLDREFAGHPINKQNLSGWRTGAYAEWRFRREILLTSLEMQSRRSTNRNQAENRPGQGDSSIDLFPKPAADAL